MRGVDFIRLMRGEKPVIVNMPGVTTSGSSIEGHIEGHDALVFRRDGVTTWNALVPLERYEGVK